MVDYALFAFYAFAALAVMSAVAVISVRNPVHAALFLVLTFFTVACTWILAGAEFLGVALILVYVGAVMVLFLFVVMMLDIDVVELREGYVRYLPVGLLVAAVMLGEMLTLIGIRSRAATPFGTDPAAAADMPNTTWLAHAMFSDFVLPFEIAAVILTIAVIAAVMLTLRRRVGTKHQNPSAQARVKASDRFHLVKMQPTRTAPAEPSPSEIPSIAGTEAKP
ncbi:MAG: NADH-quinone oxidoreductase subunit J [Luteimonas sp.]